MEFVVTYDIADDRRRQHMAETLLNYGMRAERSVFIMHLDEDLLHRMRSTMEKILEPSEDAAHIFPLCTQCEGKAAALGIGFLPKDQDFYIV